MLARLSGQAAYAHEQAAAVARQAQIVRDERLRREYQRLEASWRTLAGSFELAERISGHLEWSAKRVHHDD